jgi:hypothetical protein
VQHFDGNISDPGRCKADRGARDAPNRIWATRMPDASSAADQQTPSFSILRTVGTIRYPTAYAAAWLTSPSPNSQGEAGQQISRRFEFRDRSPRTSAPHPLSGHQTTGNRGRSLDRRQFCFPRDLTFPSPSSVRVVIRLGSFGEPRRTNRPRSGKEARPERPFADRQALRKRSIQRSGLGLRSDSDVSEGKQQASPK